MESGEQSITSSERQNHRHSRFTNHEKTDAVLRLLKGESAETVSEELGISIARIERWRDTFVAAGSAELSKRRDGSSKSRRLRYSASIRQWLWLLFALIGIITILVFLAQRSPQD